MLVIIYIGIETAQSTLLVLRLVTGFGTFDKDFLHLTGLRILPRVTQADTGAHLVDVLTAGT